MGQKIKLNPHPPVSNMLHSAVVYLFSAHRWMEYFEKLFCKDVNVPTVQQNINAQEFIQEAGQIVQCSNCDRSPWLIWVAV
jgi:hypothetical protein